MRFGIKWQFETQTKLAIKHLHEKASSTKKIALGRSYEESRELLAPGFLELIHRSTPLDHEEGVELGLSDVILLGQLKHQRQTFFGRLQDLEDVEEALSLRSD